MNIYYHKKVDLDIISFWKEIIKMSLTPILLSLIAIYISNNLTIDNWLIFFLAIGVFTLIYIPLFWLGSMNNYEKSLALSLINKIRKKK